ncbi:MAG: DUF624 domain-containing protein [Eubacteriales bacterium]|nr:DUF624 domain-containing protein [Eubacteriales bacterium]
MSRFFNMESPFFQFLSRVADLMILNLIFLVTCLPIITIGAAWTALYYTTLKMVRNEESYIVRDYFKSFKENFKQATLMWLAVLVFIVILFLDYNIIRAMTGSVAGFFRIATTAIGLLGIMILLYLFPVLSKFYNSIKNTFVNALLMSIRHLPQTLIMMVISTGAVVITFLTSVTLVYGSLLWLLFGFALIALANSWFLVRIFDHYIPEQEAVPEEDPYSYQPEASVFKNIGTPLPENEEKKQ